MFLQIKCFKKTHNITHNCLICDDNYPYNISKNNYSNCYDNNSYYNYLTEENELITTFINNSNYIINSTYPDKSLELLLETTENIKNNEMENLTKNIIKTEKSEIENLTDIIKIEINEIKNLIKNITRNKIIEETNGKKIKYYDIILDIIETGFTSGNYNISGLDNGRDETIITKKITITFTTVQNQKTM